jgi:hypothetical protein
MDQDKCFFLCIEPCVVIQIPFTAWKPFEKEGIQLLEPHSNFNASFSIEIV